MTHEEMIAVITAHKEGKQIQFRTKAIDDIFVSSWSDIASDSIVWNFDACEYRVKSEPKYRPYKGFDECFAEVRKHGGWVKTVLNYNRLILSVRDGEVDVITGWVSYEVLVQDYCWADDGTPCGILEE